jgi:fructose-bisphosphate aldolase class I
MLFTAPQLARFISGAVVHDEILQQKNSVGTPLTTLLTQHGILAGIKADIGPKRLAGSFGETVTEGLDGLRDRLKAYRQLDTSFATWRSVFRIDDALPSATCLHVNAHALARFAALSQDENVLPVLEVEVQMDGLHSIERCDEVSGETLEATFDELYKQRVNLGAILVAANMVVPGKDCPRQASVNEIAIATMRCFQRIVPLVVPGIAFLCGRQSHLAGTILLNAINTLHEPKPWKLTFSYGRALQDEALQVWLGNREHVEAGQSAFLHRARCVSAAAMGRYETTMERAAA